MLTSTPPTLNSAHSTGSEGASVEVVNQPGVIDPDVESAAAISDVFGSGRADLDFHGDHLHMWLRLSLEVIPQHWPSRRRPNQRLASHAA